ncbi:HAMP domain-containing protein [Candidatus Woesearchaeota archaeon]|nr:HAMP domain-containing protein [Candidatus Woesearchaeota archaeon]
MKISIVKKLLAIMLFLTVVPLFIVGYLALNDAKKLGSDVADVSAQALMHQAENNMRAVTDERATEINEFFQETERTLEGLAREIHSIYENPNLKYVEYSGESFAFWATSDWPEHTNKAKLQGILDGTIQNEKYNKLLEMLDKEQKAKLDEVLTALLNSNFPNLNPSEDKDRFFPRFMIEKELWSDLHSVVGKAIFTKGNRFALVDFMFELLDEDAQERIKEKMTVFEPAKFIIDSNKRIANARMGYWGDRNRAVEFTYSRPGEEPFHTASNGIGNSYYCKSPWVLRDNGKVEPVWSTEACTRSDVVKVIHPIYSEFDNSGSKMVAFIEFPIDWDTLSEYVVDVKYAATGYMLMIDDKGKVIAHPSADKRGMDLRDICKQPDVVEKMINGEQGSEVFNCPAINEDIYFTYAPIPTTGWSVALVVPVREITKPADDAREDIKLKTEGMGTQNTIFMITLVTIIIVVAVSLLFAKGITDPLSKMTKAGKKIADGDLDAKIPEIKTGDEVEEIGMTMNLLVGAIKYLKGEKKEHKKKE